MQTYDVNNPRNSTKETTHQSPPFFSGVCAMGFSIFLWVSPDVLGIGLLCTYTVAERRSQIDGKYVGGVNRCC